MKRLLLFTVGLSLGGLALLAPKNSSAVAVVQLSPVRQEVALSPGKSGQLRFRLTNPTDSAIQMQMELNNFVARDDSGQPALILRGDDASKHGLKQFLEKPGPVTVEPHQTKELKVPIAVPTTASPGGYYGAIRFIPDQAGSSGQSVNLQASAASLVLLTVPGDVTEELKLSSFELKRNDQVINQFLVYSSGLKAQLGFENKGDIHASPQGQVYLKQGQETVSQLAFNEKAPRSVVLPGSQRNWQLDFSDLSLGFGKYTVGVVVSYGANNQTVTAEKTFWVVPLQYLIGAAVGLVALLILVDMTLRRRRRRRSLPRYRRH